MTPLGRIYDAAAGDPEADRVQQRLEADREPHAADDADQRSR